MFFVFGLLVELLVYVVGQEFVWAVLVAGNELLDVSRGEGLALPELAV